MSYIPPVSAQVAPGDNRLDARVAQDGAVRVIVGIGNGQMALPSASNVMESGVIQRVQADFLQSMTGSILQVNHQFQTIPFVALTVDAEGLAGLRHNPYVYHIEEDVAHEITLAESTGIIRSPAVNALGYDGSGQAIVVMDTGVENSHEFFEDINGNSRIVQSASACFSSTDPTLGLSSLCPNGQNEQIGSGAGDACSTTISAFCFHGTHVAGIAAGYSSTLTGVAPNVDVIPLQVFTSMGNGQIVSYLSDNIRALEYVYSIRNQYNIAAINMSLGSTLAPEKYCDETQLGSDSRALLVNQLSAAGIAIIAGTGNSGFATGISTPACLQGTIAVGASGDTDQLAAFSNSSPAVDLLAPGVGIVSSTTGNGYTSSQGTSMAAPHVAGAWALLRQAHPSATMQDIYLALAQTGIPITDTRNNTIRSRIDVVAALEALNTDAMIPYSDVVINEVQQSNTPDKRLEIVNRGATSVNIAGWKLDYYVTDNLTQTYTFNNTVINPGQYIQVVAGSGTDTGSIVYTNFQIGDWSASGAVELYDAAFSVDFVRWGTANVDPVRQEMRWMSFNAPRSSTGIIGRNAESQDRHEGADWFESSGTFGAINSAVPPVNDEFASALVISSADDYTHALNNTLATVSASDPVDRMPEACRSVARSVWYTYTPTNDEALSFTTAGSNFDTVISIWSGTTPQTLVFEDCVYTLTGDGNKALSHSLSAGKTYYIMISGGVFGDSGFLSFAAARIQDNDVVSAAVEIAATPFSYSQSVDFATSAGDPMPSGCPSNEKGVWFSYTATETGILQLSTQGSDYDTILSAWQGTPGTLEEVSCNDDANADYTSELALAFDEPATIYIMVSAGLAPGGNFLVLTADFTPFSLPEHDDLQQARALNPLPYTDTVAAIFATNTTDEPNVSCDNEALGLFRLEHSVWYTIQTAEPLRLTIDTSGTGHSTLIAVFEEQSGLQEIACEDGQGSAVTDFVVDLQPSRAYYVLVGATYTSLVPADILYLSVTGEPVFSNFDVNMDGIISPGDAIFVINRQGTGDMTADVNNDGKVDIEDVTLILNRLGQ